MRGDLDVSDEYSIEHLRAGNSWASAPVDRLVLELIRLGAPGWSSAPLALVASRRLAALHHVEIADAPVELGRLELDDGELVRRLIREGHLVGLGAAWCVSSEADAMWAAAALLLEFHGVQHPGELDMSFQSWQQRLYLLASAGGSETPTVQDMQEAAEHVGVLLPLNIEQLIARLVAAHREASAMHGMRSRETYSSDALRKILVREPWIGRWVTYAPVGWLPILRLAQRRANKVVPRKHREAGRTHQIAEQSGVLSWLGTFSDHLGEIVAGAEWMSANTCMSCGQPGKLRYLGWAVTLCNECCELDFVRLRAKCWPWGKPNKRVDPTDSISS
jgi:hypothetical protein